VGSDSLLYEIEFVQLFDEVLTNLAIPDFTIKINNRKILSGIAEVCGESDNIITITVAIDKLDKIGVDGVVEELTNKGISAIAIEKIKPLFDLNGDNAAQLAKMSDYLSDSEIGKEGINELSFVLDQVNRLGLIKAKVEFDVTLARGLNYYTGAIFEVKANGVKMGSICGGGRYDDLTGIFGMNDMSGVGISFGADRIYDVLTELGLFPKRVDNSLNLLFLNFGEKEQLYCLSLLKDVRANGISSEIYPTDAKLKKQMKYANDRGVKYVAIVGEEEMKSELVLLKNMETGEQEEMSIDEVISLLK
jgi:histidyl-tRNA synthetase